MPLNKSWHESVSSESIEDPASQPTTDLLDRFANAKTVATPGTVKVMREAFSDRMILWNGWLPGQVPNDPVIAEDLQENTIELEGNELRVVELGHSDTQDSTCLYVPSI
jgi:hypothetical protein